MSRKGSQDVRVQEDRHVAAWSAAALLLALFTGMPALASLFAALPMTVRLLRRRTPPTVALLVRWVVTVWFIGAAMSAMGGSRATGAIATGPWAQRAALDWINGSGVAAPSFVQMLFATALLVPAVTLFRGIAGPIVLAEAVLFAGVTAATVYSHAFNIFSATMLAVPVWTMAWIAAACVLMGSWSHAGDAARMRRARIVGASLLLAAILLRLSTAPLFSSLLHQLTTAP